MSNPRVSDVKYSIYTAPGDGSKTVWTFNFAGAANTPGYIAREHIKAYRTNRTTGVVTQIAVTAPMWVTDTTINVTPAVPATDDITIYRDTPKDMPLVDYTTTSIINERNLDKANRQSIYVAAEIVDQFLVVKDVSDAAIILANQAIVTADGAVVTANASTAASSAAVSTANAANATAARAETKVDAAVLTANAAKATAEAIDGKAQDALDTAARAETKANAAVSTANAIDGKAQNALDTSALASTKADSAITTANGAKATAEGVDAKATDAVSTANAASVTAGAAQSTANSANAGATAAVITANEAKTIAAGKQNALGYTPVRQGGGNQIALSWTGDGYIRASIDSTNYGDIPSIARANTWAQQQIFPSISVSGGVSSASVTTTTCITGRMYLKNGVLNRYLEIDSNNAMLNFVNSSQNSAVGQLSDAGIWFGAEFRPSSDARLKDEWKFFGEQFVSKLATVKAGTYRLKRTDARSIGVEAQSLREVMPDAVGVGDDGYLNVNVGGAAMAAVVYLAREIEALKARIAALEATN